MSIQSALVEPILQSKTLEVVESFLAAAGDQCAGKDASWLFALFGIETEIQNAMVFLGVIVVVLAVLGAIVTLGLKGEQGKQTLKRKLPLALVAAVCCFGSLTVLDMVVSALQDSGCSIDDNVVDQIL